MSINATGLGPQTAIPSPSNAADTSGLAFSGGFATYNGKPIALSTINDDSSGRFTDAQRGQANDILQAREKAAYGQYEGTNTQEGNKQFVVAYINYVQNLPPYEQDSQRYKGTLDSARNLLNEINAQDGSKGTSKADDTDEPDVIKILKGGQRAVGHSAKSKKSANTPTDRVDLSPAAHAYLLQTAKTPAPKDSLS